MIYITFIPCEISRKAQHEAGVFARNKLFSLLSLDSGCIYTNENGKPRCSDETVSFSISHTSNVAVCALKTRHFIDTDKCLVIYEDSMAGEIGVDIEEIKADENIERLNKISNRFFKCDVPDCEAFFRKWTRAEAYGKYTGRGLADAVKIPLPDKTFYTFTVEINKSKYILSICI